MDEQRDWKYDVSRVNCSFKLGPSKFVPTFVFDTQSKRQVIKLSNELRAIEGRGKAFPSLDQIE